MNKQKNGKLKILLLKLIMAQPAEKKTRKESDFIESYRCTSCSRYILQSICQCTNGHLYCELCTTVLKECVKCKCVMNVFIRSPVLEEIRDKFKAVCANIDCNYTCAGYAMLLKHLDECKYFKCDNTDCKFADTREQLKLHHGECKYFHCSNEGCPFVGTYKQLKIHQISVCSHRKIKCGCGQEIKLAELIEHDSIHAKTIDVVVEFDELHHMPTIQLLKINNEYNFRYINKKDDNVNVVGVIYDGLGQLIISLRYMYKIGHDADIFDVIPSCKTTVSIEDFQRSFTFKNGPASTTVQVPKFSYGLPHLNIRLFFD